MNEEQFERAATLLSQRWSSIHPACAPFPLGLVARILPHGFSVTFLLASGIPVSPLSPNTQTTSSPNVYDLSVAYSHSYRSPVLLFRGYEGSNSEVLSFEDMTIDFPHWDSDLSLLSAGGSFISAEVHPGYPTSSPWFAVHPCQTQGFMALLGQTLTPLSDDSALMGFLLAWLRVTGPVVGIRLPVQGRGPLQDLSSGDTL